MQHVIKSKPPTYKHTTGELENSEANKVTHARQLTTPLEMVPLQGRCCRKTLGAGRRCRSSAWGSGNRLRFSHLCKKGLPCTCPPYPHNSGCSSWAESQPVHRPQQAGLLPRCLVIGLRLPSLSDSLRCIHRSVLTPLGLLATLLSSPACLPAARPPVLGPAEALRRGREGGGLTGQWCPCAPPGDAAW